MVSGKFSELHFLATRLSKIAIRCDTCNRKLCESHVAWYSLLSGRPAHLTFSVVAKSKDPSWMASNHCPHSIHISLKHLATAPLLLHTTAVPRNIPVRATTILLCKPRHYAMSSPGRSRLDCCDTCDIANSSSIVAGNPWAFHKFKHNI